MYRCAKRIVILFIRLLFLAKEKEETYNGSDGDILSAKGNANARRELTATKTKRTIELER